MVIFRLFPQWKRTVICLIDDGVALSDVPATAIAGGINFSAEGPFDQYWRELPSHGSAVANTILESCPQARLFVVRLLDRDGHLDDLIRLNHVFDWLDQHHMRLGIEWICAALANDACEVTDAAYRDTPLCQSIRRLREQGVITLMPAGNWIDHCLSQGMAWPAILREVVSVGALDREGGAVHRFSKRLHENQGQGCATTLFVRPGGPGETSGATARATGLLACAKEQWPGLDALSLIERIQTGRSSFSDAEGFYWPSWPTSL